MRITNRMMTNNALNNINKNKNILSQLDQQYASGKKIQRPSEDPIVAIRALKLRASLNETTQYYKKNIPDADSWMSVTESALLNISDMLENNIYKLFNDGANGTKDNDDRAKIMQELEELKKQIYQEGNTTYAGRYVFSGYKTDVSLTFGEDSNTDRYEITEKFSGLDLEKYSVAINTPDISAYKPEGGPLPDVTPTMQEGYRIRLAYDQLDDTDATIVYQDGATITPTKKSVADADAYQPGDNEVYFVKETGELIFGKTVYEEARKKGENGISVTYEKTDFKAGQLRPEHYFDCKKEDVTKTKQPPIVEFQKSDQEISYEIALGQRLPVNVQGSDVITHKIGREIEELSQAVADVTAVEEKLEQIKKMQEDASLTEQAQKNLQQLQEQLEMELALKTKIVDDKFAKGLTVTSEYQKQVSLATADLGSRMNRLYLTENRLGAQYTDTQDLMSQNEDADIAEVIIRFTSANVIYNASLTAASKIIQNSLLDFIR